MSVIDWLLDGDPPSAGRFGIAGSTATGRRLAGYGVGVLVLILLWLVLRRRHRDS